MGMDLARAAHAEALADIQPRPVSRPSLIPGRPDLPAPFIPREATFGQLFANLARAVRQCILLEARLAAGAYLDAAPRPETAEPAPHQAPSPTTHSADHRPRLHAERLEDESAEPTNRPAKEILTDICAELAGAVQAGLVPQTATPNTGRHPRPSYHHRRPPQPQPLTALERSALLAVQCGIPPPPRG